MHSPFEIRLFTLQSVFKLTNGQKLPLVEPHSLLIQLLTLSKSRWRGHFFEIRNRVGGDIPFLSPAGEKYDLG